VIRSIRACQCLWGPMGVLGGRMPQGSLVVRRGRAGGGAAGRRQERAAGGRAAGPEGRLDRVEKVLPRPLRVGRSARRYGRSMTHDTPLPGAVGPLCAWCGSPVEQPATGRRREYCRRSCRQRAYEDRRLREAQREAVVAALAKAALRAPVSSRDNRPHQPVSTRDESVTLPDPPAIRPVVVPVAEVPALTKPRPSMPRDRGPLVSFRSLAEHEQTRLFGGDQGQPDA